MPPLAVTPLSLMRSTEDCSDCVGAPGNWGLPFDEQPLARTINSTITAQLLNRRFIANGLPRVTTCTANNQSRLSNHIGVPQLTAAQQRSSELGHLASRVVATRQASTLCIPRRSQICGQCGACQTREATDRRNAGRLRGGNRVFPRNQRRPKGSVRRPTPGQESGRRGHTHRARLCGPTRQLTRDAKRHMPQTWARLPTAQTRTACRARPEGALRRRQRVWPRREQH